jgi:putative transposase
MPRGTKNKAAWPHAPTHHLGRNGTFFVTASTYQKEHFFRRAERLDVLERGLLKVHEQFSWRLEAWAVFSNHYHFVAHSPDGETSAESLAEMLRVLHVKTAGWINRLDGAEGRQVWFNFWETRLTFQHSYFARLSYVHQNPVKHGLAIVANQYRWCSAAWFEQSASKPMVESIYRFKTDKLKVADEYEPVVDG